MNSVIVSIADVRFQQGDKILNEPAAMYRLNDVVVVILNGSIGGQGLK